MRSLRLFPCLSVLVFAFFSCDEQDENRGAFKYSDATTNTIWGCSCDNGCTTCKCQQVNTQTVQTFTSGGVIDKCLSLGVSKDNTVIIPKVTLRLLKFLPADGATNKYGFDDWLVDGKEDVDQTCYLTMTAGCHTAFKVQINFNSTMYDSYMASIASDGTNSLSFSTTSSVTTVSVSNGTILDVYSLNANSQGTAWIEITAYSSGIGTCVAGNREDGCPDAEDQLCINVYKPKSVILPVALVSQTAINNNAACQVAVGCMALQWYYRDRPHDMEVKVSLEQALDWIWGVNSERKDQQGVPLCNMLGSYNVLCAKMAPNTGSSSGCPDCSDNGQCTTCEAATSGYDETVDRCSYVGWANTGTVDYKGKHPAYPEGGPQTSYRFGINSMLLTAHYKFGTSSLTIPAIGSKCWGTMDPTTLVGKIDEGIPVPIFLGKIEMNGDSHALILCGYELTDNAPTEDMFVYYVDPLDKTVDYHFAKWSVLRDRDWHQSLYITNVPSSGNIPKEICY